MRNKTQILLVVGWLVLLNSCGKETTETKPERRNITETVFASGMLVPENLYNLTAQSDGYLISLNFSEGDIVKTNDLLAIIDNKTSDINLQSSNMLLNIAKANTLPDAPALKQIETNLQAAELKMNQDKQQAERYRKLHESNSVSKLEYENVLLTYENSKANYLSLKENYNYQKQLAKQQLIVQKSQSDVNKVLKVNNELRAVVGGKVYTKNKELGDYVKKAEVIAVIGDPKNIYAKLNVDESSISKVKLNQQVIIQLNVDKNKNYNGVITEVYPTFDSKTQSFYCKVKFNDNLTFGISGTQVQANITTSKKDSILVIPRNYLDYGNVVFVKGKGKTKVTTGFVSNEWVEIINGIDETTIIQAEKK